MFRYIAIGAALLTAWMFTGPYFVTVGRIFDKETRLYPGDERIGGVALEFMRRSPELTANYLEFVKCGVKCTTTAGIIAERDSIIRREWPRVFAFLTIRKDWGEASDSRNAREHFFAEVSGRGEATVRDRCVPRISYWHSVRGSKYEPYYRFEGFSCPSAFTPGRQARG